MTKADLIEVIANANDGMTKAAAKETLEALLAAVENDLKAGNKVTVPGFGTLEVRERAARTGKNPQTGAVLEIPASKNVAFKAGKALKEAVNN